MPPRSPFRLVAPAALVAVVVAVLLVVSSGSGGGSGAGPSATAATTTTAKARATTRRTYTVRSGDSLSSVAARYGLTVDELTRLNPRVDPQALHAGQRLHLRD